MVKLKNYGRNETNDARSADRAMVSDTRHSQLLILSIGVTSDT